MPRIPVGGKAFTTLGLLVYLSQSNPLTACFCISIVAALWTWHIIPLVKDMFIKAGLSGKDMNKPSHPVLAESMGIIAATIYMVTTILFIPIQFQQWMTSTPNDDQHSTPISWSHTFPYNKMGQYLSALLSLQSMIFLGFADDVLNLRWRFKLVLPTIASIPLLTVYYVSHGVTFVMVPFQFRDFLGQSLDLGVIYYVYMGMMAVFCTNSINILAGINGVEVGQSLVIGISVAIYNLMRVNSDNPDTAYCHLFSLYLILPFIAVSAALFHWNRFPAKVFVGDTYCYFAGMTFAVVGILGHFSKTLLLLFIPQILNFIYSCPQLFRLVPCPRHRLPSVVKFTSSKKTDEYDKDDKKPNKNVVELMEPSRTRLADATHIGLVIIKTMDRLGLVSVKRNNNGDLIDCSNLTLLNLFLVRFGPMTERRLAWYVISFQIFGSVCAFFIRHNLATLFYEDIYK
ncbi:tunicamycin resistance protein [Mycoemilia scoparia]|uniref:UDP-N-acetylglucosamine--dolichyl-phosphate N-acetylglucosaminephosphotransferase n=1 Tax=Mycoemilia scoparia TaxID=417184 RepID=A0A9W7ZYG2_9FUNG|nr:tunicamycin resistance protein [Mycoemilia scoparia]